MKRTFYLVSALIIGLAIGVTAVAWWPEISSIERGIAGRIRGDHLPRDWKLPR